jgi:adenosine deaminase
MKLFRTLHRFRAVAILPLLLLSSSPVFAQTKSAKTLTAVAPPSATASERRAELGLAVAKASPLALRAWLFKMPKGADLHNHLSGAIYAETFIKDAAEDHLCVNVQKLAFAKPKSIPADGSDPLCDAPDVPAAKAFTDQDLYDSLVDSFSMRSFVPSTGDSAHDHFFATFDKFRGTDKRHLGEWLDEVATRADSQNEQYLELMHTPDSPHATAAAKTVPFQENFAQLREQLLAQGLRDDIALAKAEADQAEALRAQREHCAQSDAAPACRVQIRFVYQILRGRPKEFVFAQTLLGFETASADPRFVGLNFVMPEDGYVSMTDYALHMRMLEYFHSVYPNIHIALHAGELAPGLVPYEGLCCHVQQAVEVAHAERIGHGVDILYETHPHETLKEMAAKHVVVEINLTSNDVILGVSGKNHPFEIYRQFNVPMALSTDDEGVSRIDLTNEYARAAETYNLRYADLKKLARTSLEHSFLPGASLWREPDNFRAPVKACASDALGAPAPKKPCADFLISSEKARQQWELEHRFQQFESQF